MKKGILLLATALMFPFNTFAAPPEGVGGGAPSGGGGQTSGVIYQYIDGEIQNLQNQLDTIELTPGPQGEQGIQGETGPIGPAGADGADGATGAVGATGPAGADGATGPQGEQGIQGEVGPEGPQGAQGPRGLTGATGSTGPQGPQGTAGADGLAGADGADGESGMDSADGVYITAVITTTFNEQDALEISGANLHDGSNPVVTLAEIPLTVLDLVDATGEVVIVSFPPTIAGSFLLSLSNSQGESQFDMAVPPWELNGVDTYYTQGNVGIGTTNPASKLDVNGGIKIGNETADCTSSIAGAIRFNGTSFEGCDGAAWVALSAPGSGGDDSGSGGGDSGSGDVFYAPGDTGPAGGIVFHITDADGLHGLEAAPGDQDLWGRVRWGCYGTSIAGAYGIAVGTGAQNTEAILAGCSEAGIAAEIADAYTLNGYSDWFLPSLDELMWLHDIWKASGEGGFEGKYYWSSTEYDPEHAYYWSFGGRDAPWYNKDQGGGGSWVGPSVRAVRVF